MGPNELRSWLDRIPYIPLRFHATGGGHYDIYKPQFVMLGRTVLLIGLRRDIDSPLFDEPVMVPLIHITRVEPLIESIPPVKQAT